MCGIAGILRLSKRPLPERRILSAMLSAISHRGPDEQGSYFDEWMHVGAVRLSILDLEKGGQPAKTPSGRTIAVQNGEIYNFATLARDLQKKGHELSSTGDTIVLPHMHEEYGAEFVSQLRGMYAIAVWDSAERRLLLCRDRLGIKPLFFAKTTDYLLFASEIKALLATGLIVPAIDRRSLDDLFSLSYPCPPRSMFKGVDELLPAHTLMVYAGRGRADIRIERYWRIPFARCGEHSRIGFDDAASELKERLRKTIADHMVADVKVGTYLSSGVDSSSVTALAREIAGEPLDCFTISFPSSTHDEATRAAQFAASLGCRHHLVECGPETAELFLDSVYHTELPLQYPVSLPLQRLSKVVQEQGFKVVLTGEGVDEQYAGYDCFRLERIRKVLEFAGLSWLKPYIYRRLFSWLGSPQGMAEFFIKVQRYPDSKIRQEFSNVRPPWYDIWHALDIHRSDLLGVNGRSVRPIEVAPEGFNELFDGTLKDLHPLDAALAIEMQTRLPSWTVLVDDRVSMANGVETRVPFLDHELVEWVAKLPPSYKLRGLNEKAILRASMKGVLPQDTRKRIKQPFYSPIKEWFFSPQSPEFASSL
ncbi:MAG: asparagine synthase (glutamine-hydrolyzing), partial [Deltaproteobacteria bacterium]|nr:asparagine synthase (glutamine-hydrolyzing) [Deltaproteobacteria bacterium]